MDWLNEVRESHRTGYAPVGKCIACRRKQNCPGGRFKNECPNYLDPIPTRQEYMEQYGALLQRLVSARGEPERGDLLGTALSRRTLLREHIGITEVELREVEDTQPSLLEEPEQRTLRRLRWQL